MLLINERFNKCSQVLYKIGITIIQIRVQRSGGSSYIHNGAVDMYCDSNAIIRVRTVSTIGD